MNPPILIWHIGGGTADIGPAQKIVDFAYPTELQTFEAMEGKCFASHENQTRDFYVTRNGLASGLYKADKRMLTERTLWQMADGHFEEHIWGEQCAVERVISMQTVTVDGQEGQPDVLSIDTQGAELEILLGAEEKLENVLCVIAECEFQAIYQRQGMFSDQSNLLQDSGFRLVELMNRQYWQPDEGIGDGFLTVAEAVWFRWDVAGLSAMQLLKLAHIAIAFNRYSYAKKLTKQAEALCAA